MQAASATIRGAGWCLLGLGLDSPGLSGRSLRPKRGPSLREPSFSGLQAQVSLALLRDSRHHPPKAWASAGERRRRLVAEHQAAQAAFVPFADLPGVADPRGSDWPHGMNDFDQRFHHGTIALLVLPTETRSLNEIVICCAIGAGGQR